MRRHLALSLVIVSALASTTPFSAAQMGQSAASGGSPTQQLPPRESDRPSPSGMTITVGTQLVQVDVVVQDGAGHAIHGLKLSDFQVAEDKKQQGIKNFEEHISVDPTHAKISPAVKLGPGMAVTAEIKTGKRTVIDYLLSPIAQRAHDALRER